MKYNIGDNIYVEINGTNEVVKGIIVSRRVGGFLNNAAYVVKTQFGLRAYIEPRLFPTDKEVTYYDTL